MGTRHQTIINCSKASRRAALLAQRAAYGRGTGAPQVGYTHTRRETEQGKGEGERDKSERKEREREIERERE